MASRPHHQLSSSGEEASRMLAAWLRGPRARLPSRGAPTPLVLFLCHSNTALSIMAEAILRHRAHNCFRAASAGAFPSTQVRPEALECLRERGIATAGLRSKGCDEFRGPYRWPVSFLILLSELGSEGAGWDRNRVRPTKAHWLMPDPSAVEGSELEIRAAFAVACRTLEARIQRFLALPLGLLDGRSLTVELERIGVGEEC